MIDGGGGKRRGGGRGRGEGRGVRGGGGEIQEYGKQFEEEE